MHPDGRKRESREAVRRVAKQDDHRSAVTSSGASVDPRTWWDDHGESLRAVDLADDVQFGSTSGRVSASAVLLDFSRAHVVDRQQEPPRMVS
jgi:hypothetical protein